MQFNDVVVVMITKDEEHSVKKVITDIKKYVPGCQIIIVDSSTDKTAAIARANGATVIRQFPPRGYGNAMILGLKNPKENIVVTMDCDDTYPAKDIPLLVAKIHEGYDLVNASRISRGKPRFMPLFNYLANKIFNYFASIMFLKRIEDIHSGMRAYKRGLIHAIDWQANHPALPVELFLKPVALGYKTFEIPIAYKERIGVTKLQKFSSTLWTFIRIIQCRLSFAV
jgi:glycosyltransferase involved in cell wall biosynthesis